MTLRVPLHRKPEAALKVSVSSVKIQHFYSVEFCTHSPVASSSSSKVQHS